MGIHDSMETISDKQPLERRTIIHQTRTKRNMNMWKLIGRSLKELLRSQNWYAKWYKGYQIHTINLGPISDKPELTWSKRQKTGTGPVFHLWLSEVSAKERRRCICNGSATRFDRLFWMIIYISLCKGICKQWNLRETWQNNRTTVTAQNWYHVIMLWMYKTKHRLLHITVWMLIEAYAQYVNCILWCKRYVACINCVGVVNQFSPKQLLNS